MSQTIQTIFDIALAHMDEVDAQNTEAVSVDYALRTPGIVTALYPECFRRDTKYRESMEAATGAYPHRQRPGALVFHALEDEVPLDDELCLSVMPYGLAAALLADENPPLAQFFQQRYEELLQAAETIRPLVRQPSDWEPIEDVYGGLGDPYQGWW
jgi:hypothetical protein